MRHLSSRAGSLRSSSIGAERGVQPGADHSRVKVVTGKPRPGGPRSYMLYWTACVVYPGMGAVRCGPRVRASSMDLLTTLLLIAMLATLGALVVGLAGFFHGGEFNRKYSNKLMQARVVLQAIAVLLLLMLLLGVGRS